ncbi:hypothetical protein E2C01_085525 [Portunus trituberculatus]|uniref:Uncharacterized protein n=1 Tax=Portunus trituberculatus TaxID=210409 RepID=A0A5B7J728_PORTR|nr:hypothetical protein [Portunus trituberculatus]
MYGEQNFRSSAARLMIRGQTVNCVRTVPWGPNSVPGGPGHIEDREADGPGASNPSVSPNQSRLYQDPARRRHYPKNVLKKR